MKPSSFTQADYQKISWYPFSDEPLIQSPVGSPVIADPTFMFPEQSPDGLWHLFAHSIFGIHHYFSTSGIDWKKGRMVKRHAMRPYIYKEKDTFYLLYEKYPPFRILFSGSKRILWKSRIEMITSRDLKKWSDPVVLLSPEQVPWSSDSPYGASLSNPCLVKDKEAYRLYFSASLVNIEDCGFCEPRYLGVAFSGEIGGPYRLLSRDPIMSPIPNDPWRNLSCGSLKVLKLEDGYAGFQNGIYWDRSRRQSGSAIVQLESSDGLTWKLAKKTPIIKPVEKGWASSHIYACDIHYKQEEGCWYCYFNARNTHKKLRGKERIGLFLGQLPLNSRSGTLTESELLYAAPEMEIDEDNYDPEEEGLPGILT